MTGPARKPASKLPHLRKQMQKNQIAKGTIQRRSLRQLPKGKNQGKG